MLSKLYSNALNVIYRLYISFYIASLLGIYYITDIRIKLFIFQKGKSVAQVINKQWVRWFYSITYDSSKYNYTMAQQPFSYCATILRARLLYTTVKSSNHSLNTPEKCCTNHIV